MIELKVVPMTSATCFHSSSCCSFLSFSSHLSSFLSMVEETFSSTRNTRGSTLSTTKRLSSVQLCHDVTIMSLPLFSGSRSQEWTLLSVTVCPLLYPHSCPVLVSVFFFIRKEKRGGINYYQNCGLQEALLIACREMFCKDKNSDKLSERPVL